MNKICPILLQTMTARQLESAKNDPYNLYNIPREAMCIECKCMAYDSANCICKYFNSRT